MYDQPDGWGTAFLILRQTFPHIARIALFRQAKEHMPIQSMSYNISKAGVAMLNAMFSIDDHCKGITFVALHPGWVDTGKRVCKPDILVAST
jgi:NAD(P)-dependent dehydrogenase (short-subunit alcohol dehydrogenase family)